ncbi:hypothetical protein PVAG01_02175 [Phlyctema vagabunda]|uniref:RRM domain-containing protein n=1 Tax=Phlyctema vagabunda TaxID=108571 RepID=A0ABR4PPT4_9HELO
MNPRSSSTAAGPSGRAGQDSEPEPYVKVLKELNKKHGPVVGATTYDHIHIRADVELGPTEARELGFGEHVWVSRIGTHLHMPPKLYWKALSLGHVVLVRGFPLNWSIELAKQWIYNNYPRYGRILAMPVLLDLAARRTFRWIIFENPNSAIGFQNETLWLNPPITANTPGTYIEEFALTRTSDTNGLLQAFSIGLQGADVENARAWYLLNARAGFWAKRKKQYWDSIVPKNNSSQAQHEYLRQEAGIRGQAGPQPAGTGPVHSSARENLSGNNVVSQRTHIDAGQGPMTAGGIQPYLGMSTGLDNPAVAERYKNSANYTQRLAQIPESEEESSYLPPPPVFGYQQNLGPNLASAGQFSAPNRSSGYVLKEHKRNVIPGLPQMSPFPGQGEQAEGRSGVNAQGRSQGPSHVATCSKTVSEAKYQEKPQESAHLNPERDHSQVSRPKSIDNVPDLDLPRAAESSEPLYKQNRVVHLLNLPRTIIAADVSDAICEGPLYSIQFGTNVEEGTREATIIFCRSSSAELFYNALLKEKQRNVPRRFQFCVDAELGEPYPANDIIKAMSMGTAPRRRLTIMKRLLFDTVGEYDLRILCEETVGKRNIQSVRVKGSRYARIVFTEVPAAIHMMHVLRGMVARDSTWQGADVIYSKDPCESTWQPLKNS